MCMSPHMGTCLSLMTSNCLASGTAYSLYKVRMPKIPLAKISHISRTTCFFLSIIVKIKVKLLRPSFSPLLCAQMQEPIVMSEVFSGSMNHVPTKGILTMFQSWKWSLRTEPVYTYCLQSLCVFSFYSFFFFTHPKNFSQLFSVLLLKITDATAFRSLLSLQTHTWHAVFFLSPPANKNDCFPCQWALLIFIYLTVKCY